MRVVGITQDLSYCSWWRIEQPFNFLKDNGVDTSLCWLDSEEMPTESVKDAVVVLHRVLIRNGPLDAANKWIKKLKTLGARKIIYEIDDDVFSEHYVEHMTACGRASVVSLKQLEDERQRVIRLIQACDEITVTTHALNKLVSEYTRKPIHVLPNSLNIDWYNRHLSVNPENQNRASDVFQYINIGWAGGLRPDRDFEDLAKAWTYIDKKYANVRFIIGGYQPNILWKAVDYDKIVRVPWAKIEEWPKTMQVDIGCTTLATTPFNKCKSPVKAIEYIMAGAMPIGNSNVYNIPELEEMPIVSNVEGWIYWLEYYINNWLQRALTVKQLQQRVTANFNLSNNWTKWFEAYSS